jgi:adenine phosphoribosyltransferase
MDLKRYIRDVPDFPKPGVLFRDIAPLLADPAAFEYTSERALELVRAYEPTKILAIESRGFVFAAPMALQFGVPMVLARKAGKLPGKCMSVEYGLEYGTSRLEVQVDALSANDRILIVDDVLATGGTAAAAEALVEMSNAKIAAFLFIIELTFLKGRESLGGAPVLSLVQY